MELEVRVAALEAEMAAAKLTIVAQQIGLIILVDRLSATTMTFDRARFAEELNTFVDDTNRSSGGLTSLQEALAALANHIG